MQLHSLVTTLKDTRWTSGLFTANEDAHNTDIYFMLVTAQIRRLLKVERKQDKKKTEADEGTRNSLSETDNVLWMELDKDLLLQNSYCMWRHM